MQIYFYRSPDFPDVASSYDSAVKQDEISGKASPQKYLQVALLADESVVAKHGNQTTNFLLVLANIVSGWKFGINTVLYLFFVTDYIAFDRYT